MKALVLSGGKGTRLRPITHTSAKQLIPVANKPILFYGLQAIREAGIEEVGIVVGETAPEIKKAVANGQAFGLRVTYIDQPEPLGLAHAVKISRDYIGTDEFVVYLGDNLIRDGIKELVEDFKKNKPNCQILLAKVPNPSQFGVAELKDERVVRVVEKPREPKSDLALVGVYMFDKHIFKATEVLRPSARGELEITDAIQYLIDKKYQVRYHLISGWWKDTGKLEDLLEANRLLLEVLPEIRKKPTVENSSIIGKVIIEDGCQILNSTIRGPVAIGKNSKIVNSYIGPFSSVYYNVEIRDSEIEHSIILENSRIESIKRLEESLIGQNVWLGKTERKPQAYRIMVGDSSRIELP